MKKTIRALTLSVLICFLTIINTFAQAPELEFSFGFNLTTVNFDHPTEIETDDEGLSGDFTSQLGIAVSAPIIKSKLYLRTNFGFTSANGTYRLEYDVNTNQSPINRMVWTQYNTRKLYLSLTPEYRFNIVKEEFETSDLSLHLKVNGGLLLHTNIANTSEAITLVSYQDLPPSTNGDLESGFTLGIGLGLRVKNVGASFNISYLRFGKSELFTPDDPSIIYQQTYVSLGIFYLL